MSEYNYPADAMPPARGRPGAFLAGASALASAPQLAAHHVATLRPAPMVDRRDLPFAPGLYRNDALPDCTAVALANAARAVAIVNGYELAVEPERVPEFYASCVGVAPTTEAMAATSGAVALDVLNRQAVHGFDVGAQSLVGLHGVLPPRRTAVASAIDRLGHAYIVVELRERDMELSPVWDVEPRRDDGEVVGWHAVVGWDYLSLADDGVMRLATWGGFQRTAWRWIDARMREAYGIVWRQLVGDDGTQFGVDVATLTADLAAMRG